MILENPYLLPINDYFKYKRSKLINLNYYYDGMDKIRSSYVLNIRDSLYI